VISGIRESETEYGGHFFLCNIGIWIEILVQDGQFPSKKVGVRWTIDAWETYKDSFAVLKQPLAQEEELWRVEIDNLVTSGWRNGSIGGPNGEQPSGHVWTLWGPSKKDLQCLPLGIHAPDFEFVPFMKAGETEYWDNNSGFNYTICLSKFGEHPTRQG
jgi:hypothetical protein